MNLELLLAGSAAGGALLTKIAQGFFNRKKDRAEYHRNELDAVEKAVAIWRNLAEKMTTDVRELKAEIAKLHIENDQLREQLQALRVENEELRELISDLKTKLVE